MGLVACFLVNTYSLPAGRRIVSAYEHTVVSLPPPLFFLRIKKAEMKDGTGESDAMSQCSCTIRPYNYCNLARGASQAVESALLLQHCRRAIEEHATLQVLIVETCLLLSSAIRIGLAPMRTCYRGR